MGSPAHVSQVGAGLAHGPGSPASPAAITSAPDAAATLGDLAWNLRGEVALPLLMLGVLYAIGWARLWRRDARAASWTRLAVALAGLAGIALALLSPLDALADRRFVAHMLQHMLLVMVAAPALLLADPFPIILWALPRMVRVRAGRWLRRSSPFGRLWGAATALPPAWLVYAVILWLWHVPALYEAALASRLLHDLEHLTFFLSAVLFWWSVIEPAPRFHRPASHAARIVYLMLAAFQTAALGLLLTVAPVVLYGPYAAPARPEAFSALDDQMWGGVAMWGVGGLIDMLAILALLYRYLSVEARDRPRALTR